MTTQTNRDGAAGENPFPGLRPFETDEYHLFFGREGQTDELLARLGRTRFLAVVGTSGSGKSSLVRAGLLPALYGGLMAGAGSAWRIAIMRPGHDPLGNLARSLSSPDTLGSEGDDADVRSAVIEATLRRGALGLVDAVSHSGMMPHENLLVVVDQFEELFRFRAARSERASEDDAAAFVKLLLEVARSRDVPVYVVITMRSDFLGDCAQFWGLPEAINDGQYLIPRMTRDERRAAITGPAAVAGVEITHPLVNRLLNDAGDNPDQLPILQHALMRTWEHWESDGADGDAGIGLEHYDAVGGMADALSRHAEEAFAELADERSRLVAERIFKRLTERGADNREVRRPTRMHELVEVSEATEDEVISVVETFRREGRSFLMPPAGTPLTPDTIIDISHESLIRNWGRLREWVDEEEQAGRTYKRLAEAAVLKREGREGLLTDPALTLALEWREHERPNRAWAARYHEEFDEAVAYLEESRAHRDAQAEAERERQRRELEMTHAFADEQARAARRLRRLAVGLVVLVALSLAAFAFAVREARKAREAGERESLNRHALAMIESYEMEKAESELNRLYDMLGDDREGRGGKAWALYNLGYLNEKLERFDRAVAFYQSALDMQRSVYGDDSLETVGMLDDLARVLQEQRIYDDAVSRYEQLLSILNGSLHQKDKYFKLNTANVHADLAQLYVDRSLFENYDASRAERAGGTRPPQTISPDARRKAEEQYARAFAIWEEALGDDKAALASKFVKASKFYRESLNDVETSSRFEQRADELLAAGRVETARVPLGRLNPGGDPQIGTLLPERGRGYVTHNREADGADQYGRASTVETIKRLGEAWAARHPNAPISVGDLSRRGGGPFPPHPDHQNGNEVDFRPFTDNGLAEPTNIFAPNYSRELTRELVLLIKGLNPKAVIRFNDPALVSEGLTTRAFGHDSYLHVLLP